MTIHLSMLRCTVLAIALASSPVLLADSATNSTSTTSTTSAKKTAPDRKLNLKVPDVNKTMTPAEQKAATSGEPADGSEKVEVESQRAVEEPVIAPKPPGGLASVFWAFAHPVQAWRVFFPEPPEQQQISASPKND